jgi:hypothetical protein
MVGQAFTPAVCYQHGTLLQSRINIAIECADNPRMATFGGRCRLAAALVLVSLFPCAARAQESIDRPSSLRIPTIAASAAAAADWVTTYHAITNYQVHETNPLLKPWYDSPGKMVGMGALMDVGGITAWNMVVGPKHPRIAAAGLWATAAFRSYLAFHNLRNEQRAARR